MSGTPFTNEKLNGSGSKNNTLSIGLPAHAEPSQEAPKEENGTSSPPISFQVEEEKNAHPPLEFHSSNLASVGGVALKGRH